MSFPSHTDIFSNVATEAKYPLVNGQQIVPSGVGIGRGFNTSLTTTPTAGQGTSLRELRVRDLSDVDKYLEPTETPFWSSIKQGGEVRTARSEWAISHLTPNTTTVGSTGFNGTDNSVAVDLDEPGRVTPGSMIMVGSEQIWVHPDGVSSTGLVAGRYERGIGGTTIAAHGDGVKVDILLEAALENQDTPFRGDTAARIEWNTNQLVDIGIWSSDRDRMTPDIEYGSGDKHDARLAKIIVEQSIKREKTAILSNRSAAAGTGYGSNYSTYTADDEWLNDPEPATSIPRTVGGLRYFTPLAYNLAGQPLTASLLELIQLDTVDRVGETNTPNKLYVGGFMRVVLNSLFNDNRVTTVKDKVYNVVWNRVEMTWGYLDFVYSRYIPEAEAYFVNTNDITKHWYKGGSPKEVILPSNGPYKRSRYTFDWTMKFRKTQCRSRIYGISTNMDDYANLAA